MYIDDFFKNVGSQKTKNVAREKNIKPPEIKMIHYSKLKPSKENFYDTNEIDDLAAAIRLFGGLKSPIHVWKTNIDEFEVIEGHRRRLAIIRNIEQFGRREFEFVPCILEDDPPLIRKINLILSNATQRERTEYEKMEEARRLKVLLGQYEKEMDVKLSALEKREKISEILKVSETKVAQLENINNNLVPEAKEKFKKGEMPVSVANEMAGLPETVQKKLADREDLKLQEVKKVKKDVKKQNHMEVEQCAYDPKITCPMKEIVGKYKKGRNIAECPGCCHLCGYTDECEHVCKRVLDNRKLSEKDLERVTFTFQDVKATLGYVKQQIPKTKMNDQESITRLKVMSESLQKYMKDMTERVEVSYDGE